MLCVPHSWPTDASVPLFWLHTHLTIHCPCCLMSPRTSWNISRGRWLVKSWCLSVGLLYHVYWLCFRQGEFVFVGFSVPRHFRLSESGSRSSAESRHLLGLILPRNPCEFACWLWRKLTQHCVVRLLLFCENRVRRLWLKRWQNCADRIVWVCHGFQIGLEAVHKNAIICLLSFAMFHLF